MGSRNKYRIAVFTLILLSILIFLASFSRITFNSDWRTLVPDNKYTQQYNEIEKICRLGTQLTLVLSFENESITIISSAISCKDFKHLSIFFSSLYVIIVADIFFMLKIKVGLYEYYSHN